MARTGSIPPRPEAVEPGSEPEVDFMSEAPPARPYHEAVTPVHRALLADSGVIVPEGPEAA